MGLEGEITDDSFDSLEGYFVWSCVKTGEAGDGVHDIEASVVAEVEKNANEGAVGSFVKGFEFVEFDGSCRYG